MHSFCIRRAVRRHVTRSRGLHSVAPWYDIAGQRVHTDATCNTNTHVLDKVGWNLHLTPNHPLHILKARMEGAFPDFRSFDNLPPVVSTQQNFDSLLIPSDHVSRSPRDTFYLNKDLLLRPHTSAHQHDLLSAGHRQFLVCGDVYRRDTIDRTHYWAFHQMEGVKIMDTTDVQKVEADLKASLEKLVRVLFGNLGEGELRWVDAYFPFTEPSFELEIMFQGEWLEVLGCGVMQEQILRNAAVQNDKMGWAFGIGLERIAMPLFKIPDIRLFWSQNKRFLSQFEDGKITEFRPLVSLKDYPPNMQSISFWIPDNFSPNDFYDLVRSMSYCDLVEEVILFDEFTHPKTGRTSNAFHVNFRSPEKTLTTHEVNQFMAQLRETVVQRFGVELR
eukprot:NODE_702_length_1408_cov_270.764533_g532_i0.p1 GENE.NODE_702_length_1408_cov_270.764533_g532_i0~~NODE_702_length_1408_cov_270.764533_g532_i0.p1  ORF type:complete len:389 (+),score=63.53 NODE_702_length_1408_cov_270.764533_g532_i0:126-1292(+)